MAQKEIAKKMAILPQSPLVPEGILVKDLVAYGRFPYQKPMSGLSKEEAFAAIDEKLRSIRETLQQDQQIDMEQFYLIFTRSNELIHVVDCRSQEEFDSCHISHAKTLVYM